MNDLDLEQRLVSSFIRFTKDIAIDKLYKIEQFTPDENDKFLKIISLSLHNLSQEPEAYPGGEEIFHHFVYFRDGQMSSDRTCGVASTREARHLYKMFIEYLKAKERIALTNDFESLWNSDPNNYPV